MIRRSSLALVWMFAAACGGDDGGGGGPCTTGPDTCSGTDVCIDDMCVAAFPHDYRVTNVNVLVAASNIDDDGTGPDLVLHVLVGGNLVAMTDAPIADNYAPVFAGPFDISLAIGNDLTLRVLDQDVVGGSPTFNNVYDCVLARGDAASLRARAIACDDQAGDTMTATIEPR